MKILHINDTYAMTGGITRYLLDVMALLEQYGHENVVVYQQQHDCMLVNGCSAYYVPMSAPGETTSYAATQRVLAKQKPDIVFLHAAYDPGVVAAVVEMAPTVAYVHGFHTVCPALAKYFRRGDEVCTRRFGLGCVPMIYARRCSDARHPKTVYRLMRITAQRKQTYQSASMVIVASRYMRNLLLQNGFCEQRVVVLPYPHMLSASDSSAPGESLRILYAGRLEIEKGVPYLLRAFARITMPCELRIAGDGTLRPKYKAMAQDLGVTQRVRFLGWLDDDSLAAEYQATRLVVMPTICPEAFGQVGVQALSHGCPVVAFDVGGIADWLKDAAHGFLVASRDVEALADRIETLLNDPALAAEMGARGRAFVLQAYEPERHITRLLEIFDQVIGSG